CCFTGVNNTSKGVDAELIGEAMNGWNIGAGYSYNVSEFPLNQPTYGSTPKHLLKAWTDVRLPGALSRWHVGGSLQAQSQTQSDTPASCFACAAIHAEQPAFAVFDLRTAFDVDRHWRVALSLNNVFDEVYYETVDRTSAHAWYGEPRNWMLRVD